MAFRQNRELVREFRIGYSSSEITEIARDVGGMICIRHVNAFEIEEIIMKAMQTSGYFSF